ncbi:MAG: Maf family protein [Gammaproteobacteria bacterium]|nr:Maf family protein [Gammaproteobacteria bacterium]
MIFLASNSPRRAELLRQIGVAFKTLPVDIDESLLANESAESYVCRIAGNKANAGEDLISALTKVAPVLAADTIINIDGNIVGKPADIPDCRRILAKLSGRQHQVLSAVALKYRGELQVRLSVSQVSFRPLDEGEIEAYCSGDEPLDKAGAYAIQGKAAVFIDNMEGSYSSVMGLPLFETAELLKRAGIAVLRS